MLKNNRKKTHPHTIESCVAHEEWILQFHECAHKWQEYTLYLKECVFYRSSLL